MGERDPRTAKYLAERMVGSFFEGLSEPELKAILADVSQRDEFSPLFSMLSYTYDVFLQCVRLPEEQAQEFFKQAVRKKLKEFHEQLSQNPVASEE